jgi:hypothetical protein
VRGDLKAGSECATPADEEHAAKKNEDKIEKLKSEGKVGGEPKDQINSKK